jgi:hypothetical protein
MYVQAGTLKMYLTKNYLPDKYLPCQDFICKSEQKKMVLAKNFRFHKTSTSSKQSAWLFMMKGKSEILQKCICVFV